MPVMTTCRHVFCSECINGVFEMPTARGITDDDDEVEEVGESIACPVCRHKLSRQDIGAFAAPKPKEEPKLTTAEATELYNGLTWDNLDDSDNESLPDVGTIFSKQSNVKKEAKILPVISATIQSQPVETIDLDDDEDLFEVFRNNPVPRITVKKERPHMSEHWSTILDVRQLLPSAKLTALRQRVADWFENYPQDKIIIFSQFVRALDLVEKMCNEEGWSCIRYQGDMKLEQRESSLRTFEDDDDVPIMLTSLKCGGVGLNLTGMTRNVINEIDNSCE
jgi:SNF2 family DNA or RNA helicase